MLGSTNFCGPLLFEGFFLSNFGSDEGRLRVVLLVSIMFETQMVGFLMLSLSTFLLVLSLESLSPLSAFPTGLTRTGSVSARLTQPSASSWSEPLLL